MMNSSDTLREMSPKAFAALGTPYLAYVKAVTVDGEAGFAVHSADGSPMAVLNDREVAFAAVRQHDMEPLSVH
ncbi:MAG: DUF1150 family protein [Alphaproteobacteria bacterium]|jgi:hypothetical protein|nr:DUF1150 family protein [Alphaproteobacteria bacterium]MDP6516502.1 DUF1150 family protein [Alphaproteobacteria bacterium]